MSAKTKMMGKKNKLNKRGEEKYIYLKGGDKIKYK